MRIESGILLGNHIRKGLRVKNFGAPSEAACESEASHGLFLITAQAQI
jgi:hypothetical protein